MFSFSRLRRSPRSPPFPYTTLFRSRRMRLGDQAVRAAVSTELMVDPAERGIAGFMLLRAFFGDPAFRRVNRSEEHTSELQSREKLVCRLLLEKKKGKPLHLKIRGAT